MTTRESYTYPRPTYLAIYLDVMDREQYTVSYAALSDDDAYHKAKHDPEVKPHGVGWEVQAVYRLSARVDMLATG